MLFRGALIKLWRLCRLQERRRSRQEFRGKLPEKHSFSARRVRQAFESLAERRGYAVNATARMTDDCQKGIAKFLEK